MPTIRDRIGALPPADNKAWRVPGPSVVFCPPRRLKCRAAPYRPAATKGNLRVPASAVPRVA